MASMVAPMASMASMITPMAPMVALLISSRSKEETTTKGVREGPKSKYQNKRRCHGAAMALLVTLLFSTVASMASVASVASMASRVLMASMATMVLVTSVAAMVALLVSSRSKEETTANGDRESHKESRENGGRCHESKVALMMTSLASMVASLASMALVCFDGFDGFVGFDGFEGAGG